MLTDDQITAHRQSLRALSQPGGDLVPESPHATVNNRAWFSNDPGRGATPRRARLELHDRLQAAAALDVPREGRAIVLAGPPGAGKSTIFDALFTRASWRVLDPDHFKVGILRQALQDGTYESFLKPRAVRALEEQGQQWFPLELAALVHEESSFLNKRARHRACTDQVNIAIDAVLGDVAKAVDLGQNLIKSGYHEIHVLDVEATYEISEARIDHRWERGYRSALASEDPHYLGDGRWVPSEFARGLYYTPGGGRCSSEIAVDALVNSCPAVKTFRRYRVPSADSVPTLESAWQRTETRAWRTLDG